MSSDGRYIRTALDSDGEELVTSHYINDVLPTTKQFGKFHCNRLTAWVDGEGREPLKDVFAKSRELNERQIEDAIIRPVLEMLDNKLIAQVSLGGDAMDFCTYEGDSFAKDYTNTGAIIESKRYGRIENKYYVRTEDNTDEVYQCLNYLRTVNLTLDHTGGTHNVEFAVLTDGYRWRIYSKQFTHSVSGFEQHFIEFDLEAISMIEDKAERDGYLKIFGIFLCRQSLSGTLVDHQKASSELGTAVTKELREQTFMALEYIATGIWRKIYIDGNPLFAAVLSNSYGINVEEAKADEDVRADLLRLVYNESLVFLLRLLFVLYAEDRNLFNQDEIPKVIKGRGNLLELIVENGKGIGEMVNAVKFGRNDDMRLATTFKLIDAKYNGGLFSSKKHPLLFDLDIDDILFARAVDNLCRVMVKKKVYTVDFSTVSVRELGGIYESLLEYKLAIATEDVAAMPSIINKKRLRLDVRKGDLILINHDGERKATGSYYTPDMIVEHLVTTALEPKLEEAKAEHKGDIKGLIDAVLDIKVCDPAMGSGHMLLAAYTRIVQFLHQCIEEASNDGAISDRWDEETSYFIRTQVARKCIYGADLNQVAVDLAKLVMWMKIFRPDKPFEFFDYNLACGNSIIGVYDEEDEEKAGSAVQISMFRTREQIEADIQSDLLARVKTMLDMPRDTVDQVHAVDRYWKEKVRPLQGQVAFFYNVKLARTLLPDTATFDDETYELLISEIETNDNYVSRIVAGDRTLPPKILALADVSNEIKERFNPLHWKIAFPHIAVAGGFSVILTNPPWDKVKPFRGDFFSDYIEGYSDMETKDAKAASDALMAERPDVREKWESYENGFVIQNSFYQRAYRYQTAKNAEGKTLKGDNNLYKVFIEKIYTILKPGGTCGIVIPDNLNIDSGCTGLRRLLLSETTIQELIMFENRKRLFEIDSRYKFDVLTFVKKKPRVNAAFDAGFYWYDPIWLDGEPDEDYIALDEKNSRKHHVRFRYPTQLIRELFPDTLVILELRTKSQMGILKKATSFPKLADQNQTFWADSYTEFDMTNDADLFRFDGTGWPLYQGGHIHHFNAYFAEQDKTIIQAEGEERLSRKKGVDAKQLPDRTYRIAWRSVAQPTDTRSMICTVLPRGVFAGNSLRLLEVFGNNSDNILVSGLNVVLSSFIVDFIVRMRIAKNVSPFIIKQLPIPRDEKTVRKLGELALPLYQGEDFEAFRGDVEPLEDESERNKLIAKLDARVAHLYGLTYEEYQSVLDTFPLVDVEQKRRCLRAYNGWTFSL